MIFGVRKKTGHSRELLHALLGRIDEDVRLAPEALDLGCLDTAPHAARQHEQG